MTNEIMFDTSKEYDHQETKNLLAGVRDFFQSKLRVIVPEWISAKKNENKEAADGAITSFYIDKTVEPIYANCNGYDDVRDILSCFEDRLNDLLDSMDDLLDKNTELDDESKRSLESYAGAIEKCLNVYNTQKKRRATKFKELSTVDEIRDELQQLFGEIIANYIIAVLFDALYERINNNSGPIYEMVVKEVNNFLVVNGVYTKSISVGDRIEPEYMEPTTDSAENFTDDFNKFDTIDEIRRYPYLFADGVKIIDGQARIWRRKD